MAFVDYEKAFDSVQISAVLDAIRKQGVEEIYCRLLEDISTQKIHAETNEIPIKKGVWQGDTFSPKLFTACLEEVFKKLDWKEKGNQI